MDTSLVELLESLNWINILMLFLSDFRNMELKYICLIQKTFGPQEASNYLYCIGTCRYLLQQRPQNLHMYAFYLTILWCFKIIAMHFERFILTIKEI